MKESDLVALRRLENGDYVRIRAGRCEPAVIVELGETFGGDTIEWGWRMELSMSNFAELHADMARALIHMSKLDAALDAQREDRLVDLAEQLDKEREKHIGEAQQQITELA